MDVPIRAAERPAATCPVTQNPGHDGFGNMALSFTVPRDDNWRVLAKSKLFLSKCT